jgi:hypothetical protein
VYGAAKEHANVDDNANFSHAGQKKDLTIAISTSFKTPACDTTTGGVGVTKPSATTTTTTSHQDHPHPHPHHHHQENHVKFVLPPTEIKPSRDQPQVKGRRSRSPPPPKQERHQDKQHGTGDQQKEVRTSLQDAAPCTDSLTVEKQQDEAQQHGTGDQQKEMPASPHDAAPRTDSPAMEKQQLNVNGIQHIAQAVLENGLQKEEKEAGKAEDVAIKITEDGEEFSQDKAKSMTENDAAASAGGNDVPKEAEKYAEKEEEASEGGKGAEMADETAKAPEEVDKHKENETTNGYSAPHCDVDVEKPQHNEANERHVLDNDGEAGQLQINPENGHLGKSEFQTSDNTEPIGLEQTSITDDSATKVTSSPEVQQKNDNVHAAASSPKNDETSTNGEERGVGDANTSNNVQKISHSDDLKVEEDAGCSEAGGNSITAQAGSSPDPSACVPEPDRPGGLKHVLAKLGMDQSFILCM